MTKGRNQGPTPDQVEDATDLGAVARKADALTVLAGRATAVANVYGDGLLYDRARIVHEARFYMGQSAEAMLEAGKRLIQIKENEPHGEFVEIVTEQLGIGERSARRLMQAAVKYLSPALDSKRPTLAVLGRSKLFDLMDEADGDLAELAEGGTVAGLNLDDMQAMSARELRAALVEARKTAAAKDAVIKKKNEKIDALTEAEERRLSGTLDEREQAQLDDLRTTGLAAEMAVRKLAAAAGRVVNAPATEASLTAARQALEFVVQVLAGLIADVGVDVDVAGTVTPPWLTGTTPPAAKQ